FFFFSSRRRHTRSDRDWSSDVCSSDLKMNLLCRLVREARYNLLVINDSDVRVESDYLRNAAAPFQDPKVGVVTALFRSITEGDRSEERRVGKEWRAWVWGYE